MPLGTGDVSWEAKYIFDIVEVSTNLLKKRANFLYAEWLQQQDTG